MPDPLSGGTALGLGAAGGFSYLSSREQADAQEESAATAERIERERLQLMRELLDEGKPLREAQIQSGLRTIPRFTGASLEALGELEQDILREPGTSETFRTGLRRGTESIMRELAPFGLSESSVTGRAIGDLSEGLLSRDIESIREGQFRLAGFAPNSAPDTLGAATAFGGQAAQAGAMRASILSDSPYADFYSDLGGLGGTAGTLGLLKLLKF